MFRLVGGAHIDLDLAPKGRNEPGPIDWVRHHSRYDDRPVDPTGRFVAPKESE
jgi:hypothetical protein